MSRVVIYSEECGVYLGHCMGLGFWSKLDPVGQDAACTFDDEADAQAHVASWDGPPDWNWRTVPVAPSKGTYATVDDCRRAGLPAWDPDGKVLS